MKDKKRAMGRGLGAILSAESKASVNSATDEGADKFVGNIVEVALEDIYPNASQPRTYFDEKALEDLAQSIKNLGIIQPITLRKDGNNLRSFQVKDVSVQVKLQVWKRFLHTFVW